ncbi:MAG: cyclic nucleotide-binding domain-containing protein [Desulfobacterales bacterium]|nr:cyclic nucleotide-binding domain-containing protein [Desulfobacterales bacterium]MBL7173728.1 cyclic nucleotide-binding domain-containing protein [Desulfobacteraceae bacterium]MBL7225393.1 cyclic nucleotide-binding domain-containing protein [Desulfobacteraceae bacterium]
MERLEIEHAIERSEFFRGLDRGYIEKIASLCQVQTYKPGEYVFCQGDSGEHLYIIAHGHISLERSVDLGARKGTAVIEVLGKGRILGCWSSLLGEPHNLMSSAICQKPTVVVAVKGTDLREMMVSNSELGFVLLERLCFLLRDRIQGAFGAMEKI